MFHFIGRCLIQFVLSLLLERLLINMLSPCDLVLQIHVREKIKVFLQNIILGLIWFDS